MNLPDNICGLHRLHTTSHCQVILLRDKLFAGAQMKLVRR